MEHWIAYPTRKEPDVGCDGSLHPTQQTTGDRPLVQANEREGRVLELARWQMERDLFTITRYDCHVGRRSTREMDRGPWIGMAAQVPDDRLVTLS